jgi:hypothetical protein
MERDYYNFFLNKKFYTSEESFIRFEVEKG